MELTNKRILTSHANIQMRDWRFIFRHPLVGLKYFGGVGRNLYELKPRIYDEYIGTNIERANFDAVFMRILMVMLQRLPQNKIRILDMCCGTGIFARNWLSRLSQSNLEYVGVDSNQFFLDYARTELPDSQRFKLVCEDATTVKLGSKFDIAIVTSAYHHIEDERKVEFLKNIREHLEDDGVAIIYEKTVAPFYTRRQQERSSINFYGKRIRYMKKTGEHLSQTQLFGLENEMYLTAVRKGEYKVSHHQIEKDIRDAGFRIKGTLQTWPHQYSTEGDYIWVAKKN